MYIQEKKHQDKEEQKIKWLYSLNIKKGIRSGLSGGLTACAAAYVLSSEVRDVAQANFTLYLSLSAPFVGYFTFYISAIYGILGHISRQLIKASSSLEDIVKQHSFNEDHQ